MPLTSLDYSDLLRYLAFKRQQIVLNKTQVNKLLFMCYGTYMAIKGERLFDESPKAWPYGPVFPKVYKTFDQKKMPITLDKETIPEFNSNPLALNICCAVIDKHCHASAYNLSSWSHKEGSPWHQTVFPSASSDSETPIVWNKAIQDDVIKKYFTEHPVVKVN